MKLNLSKYRFIKCVVIFLCLLFFNSFFLPAQNNYPKVKIFKTWVQLNGEPYKSIGVLYQLKDSSILISNSVLESDYYSNNFQVTEFKIENIEKISLRRKGGIGKGVWIGALSGTVLGVIIGGASQGGGYDSYGMGLAGGVAGCFVGAGLGALFGTIKLSIPIDGQLDNYYKNNKKLSRRSIKKNKNTKLLD